MIALANTIQTASAGDYVDEIENALTSYRGNAATNVSPALAAAMLRPLLKTLCKSVIGRGDVNSDASMNYEIYKYFVDNAQRVQSRNLTYGIPFAAAANVGNGQIVRLVKDQFNFNAENVYLDQKRFLCVADYQTGTNLGAEVFQLTGQTPARDDLERSGSGLNSIVTARTADDSYLQNSSFGFFSGTAAAPTAVTNWTMTDLTGLAVTVSSTYCTFDATNYFRAAPSEGTAPYAIKLASSLRLAQKLSAMRITKLNASKPYLLAVIWNAAINGAQGTLTIRMGNVNRAVTVTGVAGWNVTLVPVQAGSLAQQSCWPRLFETNDMSVSIDWTQTTAGLLIDDVLMLEGQQADGNVFYWPIPASVATYTPWKYLDSFTLADLAVSDSKIQKWIYFAFGAYWPFSLTSSITLTDP